MKMKLNAIHINIGDSKMINHGYFVQANIYGSEEAVIQDALRHLLRSRPELKIQLAVYQY